MITPRPQDAIHKAWLYRLLIAISDDDVIMEHLRFKGGTCAAMLGWLDRFSVDLDFDLIQHDVKTIHVIKQRLEKIYQQLGLEIKDDSKNGLQYFLKYNAPKQQRNTIKIDTQYPPPNANQYQAVSLSEIDRTMLCQTRETMFANKLVAVLDRWKQHSSLAGRDIYDIHHFFITHTHYNSDVIIERRNTTVPIFFKELIDFIEQNVTTTTIQQDLNSLLPKKQFQQIYKTLKTEVVMLLQDELKRRS